MRVDRLRAEAKAANASGHPARGQRLVDRALVLLGDGGSGRSTTAEWRYSRARLLITRAFSEFEMNGLERGRAAAAEAAAAAVGVDRRDLDALLGVLDGLIAVRNGQLESAVVSLDAAMDLLGELEPEERPAVLLNRGALHLLRHDLRSARGDLAACARLASELGMTRVEFKARHNLGYAEFLAGDIPAALRAFTQADALDTDVSRSVWFLDRARVLMEAGLLDEADHALADATELLRRERANQDRAEAELARAEVALLQGDWSLAKHYSSRARRDFRRRQSTGWQARADVTRWQAYLDTRGGPARVAREIRQAMAAADTEVMDRQLALIAAEANLALGRVEEASILVGAVRRPGSGDPLSARLHQHLVRAGVARAAGDLAGARRELKTGLTRLANQQARHHSLDLRTAMAVHGGRLAELDLRMALGSGTARSVFTSLERWRAMSHRRSAVRPPRDETLAELVAQLRIVTEDIRTAPPGRPVDPLRRRQLTLERAVREREWTLHSTGRAERHVTLPELRRALDPLATDVVSYFVLDHRLSAVTVARGRSRVVTLGPWAEVAAALARVRADLDAMAGRLLPPGLRGAVAASLSRDLDRLDRLLLPDDLRSPRSLLVIPARTLATVPWSLLPGRVGRPTTVSLSATSWFRGRSDPVVAPQVTAVGGPGLALAGPEVAGVAETWSDGRALVGPDGTAGALAEALVGSDVVHIAAHGVHNQDNPLFSSIRMDDGPLYAYDIPSDEPVAGHVVLSACELGLVTPRSGDEVLGLTAALLGVGARCVVSSVSRVDDTTAYETMLRYHRLLAGGLDSPTALAEALDGDIDQPAPFVCFGSPWSAA